MQIVELTTEAELREAYPVMHELRTHLSEDEYLALLAEMRPVGYRMLAVRDDRGRIVALAGIAAQVNFYYGHFIWVFDLITTATARSHGYGEVLMRHIEELARADGRKVIALTSGVQRLDAHRFYEQRIGMERVSYTFKKTLELGASTWN